MNLFEYLDYKKWLQDNIRENRTQHAYKSRLAQAAGCQRSFLSQVLNSHVNLTPEHALGLCALWKFGALEAEYFLELVNLARAGTKELERFHRGRLEKFRRETEDLGKRFRAPALADLESAWTYYSSWKFAAVHILLTVPDFRDSASIAARLRVDESTIKTVLAQLEVMGLVDRVGSRWRATRKTLHLARVSPMNVINHRNWREKAIASVNEDPEANVHYTSICSLSQDDFARFKTLALEFIARSRNLVEASKEEELACFTLDFFKV